MSEIVNFSWTVIAESLQDEKTCSKDFDAFGTSFVISAFMVKKPRANVLCFKVEAKSISYHIYEIIATVNIKNTKGPAFEIPVPLKCVISKQTPFSEIETDLELERLSLDGYVNEGVFTFSVFVSLIERVQYILTNDPTKLNINDIIKKILSPHKLMDESILDEKTASFLFAAAKSIFLSQPSLLRLKGPIILVGDLHGKYFDLIRIFTKYGFPDRVNYLFLGDYVDRGPNSLDIVYLLFALKVRFPKNIFLLRGNHECEEISSENGFLKECERKKANFKEIVNVFDTLPFAAIISDKIFVVHGGISPYLTSLDIIENIRRPAVFDADHPVDNILWSDPNPFLSNYGPSERGPFATFGKNAVDVFCRRFGFELIVRAHEITENGFSFPFGPEGAVITLFSATDAYGGNRGAVMLLSMDLHYTFDVYKGLDTIQEGQYEKIDFSNDISL
jgi:serine/threonine-protein phosphatase PP1 catalytic subunit